jgi:hypothetical protein
MDSFNQGPHLFEIIGLHKTKIYTLEEINGLLPLIYRITEEYSKEVKYLVSCLEAIPNKNSSRSLELQDQINDLIQKWQNKIERLGGKPKGLWLADFDSGESYYCWKFPETTINHYHGYQDGFTGRRHLESQTAHNNTVEKNQSSLQNSTDENSSSPD